MRVVGWEKFQGYKKRGPKWIKLHMSLIDQPQFIGLPIVARATLPCLWLAAARVSEVGKLPDGLAVLAVLSHVPQDELAEALPSLMSAGFITRDETATELSPQRERETETEGETETPLPPAGAGDSDSVRQVFERWQSVMGHGTAKLTPKRRRSIQSRLREGYTVAQLCDAIAGCKASPFHMGQNEQGTVYDDLTLICRSGEKVESFLAKLSPLPVQAVGVRAPRNGGFESKAAALDRKVASLTRGGGS